MKANAPKFPLVRNNVDVATTAKLGNWRSPRVLLETGQGLAWPFQNTNGRDSEKSPDPVQRRLADLDFYDRYPHVADLDLHDGDRHAADFDRHAADFDDRLRLLPIIGAAR